MIKRAHMHFLNETSKRKEKELGEGLEEFEKRLDKFEERLKILEDKND